MSWHPWRKIDLLISLASQLLEQQGVLMTVVDDIKTAVTTLATNFGSLDAAIQAELTAIANIPTVGQMSAADQATLQQAVTNIGTVSASMAADAAKLTASLPVTPPPATPTPAPVPPPAPTPAPSTPGPT